MTNTANNHGRAGMPLNIRNGDTVLVRMKVKDGSPMFGTVVCVEDYHGNMRDVARDSIVSVEPTPLQVGDKVSWVNGSGRGRILAIDDYSAWIKVEPANDREVVGRVVVSLADLERV